MAFRIKQGRYISRMYYGELAHPRGNVMAFFYRDAGVEANEWFFHYRFRYYVDDKVYQSNDKRSQDYVYQMDGTFEEVLPKVRQALALMTTAAGSSLPEEVEIDSDDVETISRVFLKQKWAHQEDPLSRMNPNPVGVS